MLTAREFYTQTLKTAKIRHLSDLEIADVLHFIQRINNRLDERVSPFFTIDEQSDIALFLGPGQRYLSQIDGWTKHCASDSDLDSILEKTKGLGLSPIAALGFLMWFASMGGSPQRLERALQEPNLNPRKLIEEINDLAYISPPKHDAENYLSSFYELTPKTEMKGEEPDEIKIVPIDEPKDTGMHWSTDRLVDKVFNPEDAFHPSAWRQMTIEMFGKPSPYSESGEPEKKRSVGKHYLLKLRNLLKEWMQREPTDEELLAAHKGGPHRFRRKKFNLDAMPDDVKGYIKKVMEMT